MKRFSRFRPSPAMSVALVALFVALGGVGYAAVNLPKNSVGAKAIEKNAVKAPEIAKNAVGSSEVKDGSLLCADFASSQSACQAAASGGGGGDGVGFTNTTVRSTSQTFPACTQGTNCFRSFDVTAQCALGERATGGGWEAGANTAVTFTGRDAPVPSSGTPTGWHATGSAAQNAGSTEGSVTVYVICAA